MQSNNNLFYKLNIYLICFIFTFAFIPVQNVYASSETQKIKAKSAILIEANRGQILFEKQSDDKSHIAIINKIMTALVVIGKGKLDSKVTLSKDSANSEGSVLNLQAGEKYSVDDLLYAIMLSSANDAANALAEYSSGDNDKFVKLMNDTSTKLGLKNTHFSNPTGLFDDSQYTTARDISVLLLSAVKNPDFNRIFSSQIKPLGSNSGTKMLINQNKLLWSYVGCDGGKVGYNSPELQAAVTSATRDNLRLISIVLDSPSDSVFDDSSNLLDYGFNNFKRGILVSKDHPLKTVDIENIPVDLYPIEDIYYTYPLGDSYLKSIDFKLSNKLSLPLKNDHIVGVMKYILKDDSEIDVNLFSLNDIYPPEKKISQYLKKLIENRDIFILLIILILIEFVLMIINILKLLSKLFQRFKK